MPEPLLTTKLYIPPLRPGLVPRPWLTQRLDESLRLGCKLSLISAPAGFGKTTLLVEWIQAVRRDGAPSRRTAWVSLDREDNDPARFLAYLTASLQTLDLPIKEGLLEALRSPQPPPVESVLASLVNDLCGMGLMTGKRQKVGSVYEIKVEGHLDELWCEWFDGLRLTWEGDGTSTLVGPVADQAALHGLLERVRDLGLTLLSVHRADPG